MDRVIRPVPPTSLTDQVRAAGQDVSAILSPGRIALLITLVGGLLRLYRYTALSLWFDEGGTIWFARLPWANVLGMGPTYDTHPPGYNGLIKLISLVIPELIAGRLLSVVAGTLTIPVLYALARRLLPTPAALVASGLLAFAPVHLWYSQEARQYALMTLLVACSYLALVAFHQTPRPALGAGLCVATLAAIYCEYSAVYALAGQALIFAYLTRIHRRRALPIWVAAGAVVVGFLPWLPQLTGTLGRMGQERAAELGVSPDQIRAVLLSLTGVGGYGRYYLGRETTPWESLPGCTGCSLPGCCRRRARAWPRLLRQAMLTKLAVAGLALGPPLTAISLSQIWSGFARTHALPGAYWAGHCWSGSAVTLPLPRPVRLVRYAGRGLRPPRGRGDPRHALPRRRQRALARPGRRHRPRRRIGQADRHLPPVHAHADLSLPARHPARRADRADPAGRPAARLRLARPTGRRRALAGERRPGRD